MRILNWNTEFVSPRARAGKFEKLRETVLSQDADIICLTEAYPEAMPGGGHTIRSEISGSINAERNGARKVVLWSRFGWRNCDTFGSPALPEGRFISAMTTVAGIDWHIVGMCIPYFGYRINRKFWGNDALSRWQGTNLYLNVLRNEMLVRERFMRRSVLIGDFNLQIPPGNSSRQPKAISQLCEATFAGWTIPTAGEWNDKALDKRFIDHIALTSDIHVDSVCFFSRFSDDNTEMSDHNGVVIDVTNQPY